MAKEDFENGVWRTIGGRRIFIRDGEDLASAMKRSGKFKKLRSDFKLNISKETLNKRNESYKKAEYKDEDGVTHVDMDKAKKEYAERQAAYDKKIEQFAKDQENMTNSDWQGMIEAYERSAENTKYKTVDDIMDDVKKYQEKEQSLNKNEFQQKSTNPLYEDKNYNKEQLDKMNENNIQPLKNSYSGSGWQGKDYDANLSTKEIAKNISDYAKKEYPGLKMSRKTDYNSMDFTITSSDKDIYIDEKSIDKMSNDDVLGLLRNGENTFFNRWAEDNVKGYKENHTFDVNDVKKYIKEDLQKIKNRPNQYVHGNEYYLSDYGKEVITSLNKKMNGYNYDDSDAMIDYFDTNFYGKVNIGSYDKPYETSGINEPFSKAFEEYKKKHPNTKIKTVEQFKKMSE